MLPKFANASNIDESIAIMPMPIDKSNSKNSPIILTNICTAKFASMNKKYLKALNP